MAATPNGVTVRDVTILKVAAGDERPSWFGMVLDLLMESWPSSYKDDVALELRRSNVVVGRRVFENAGAADAVRERLADELRAMSDDEWNAVADWQAVLDSVV
ncbi:MAG: hypothetical protein ACLFXM_06540 [Acidimicrobiia bacterium]